MVLGWVGSVMGAGPVGGAGLARAGGVGVGPGAADQALVRSLVTTEETLLAVGRRLRVLSRAAMDLGLPGVAEGAVGVFAAEVGGVDLGVAPGVGGAVGSGAEPVAWPLVPVAPLAGAGGRPAAFWGSLWGALALMETAEFRAVEGEHPDGDPMRFRSEVVFEGVGRVATGEWRSMEGRIRVGWVRGMEDEGRAGEWRIQEWRTEEFRWMGGGRRYFREVLDGSIRGEVNAGMLRKSGHFAATVAHYKEGMKRTPHPYFAPISVNQKEGLAVADVDGDGFDDLYITVRLGRNMLLMNQRDGTFREEAVARGLALPGHTTCALFADFDNDGDLDAMLGRSLLRTTYLENREGVYVQHPIPPFMPMAVISMAAADYNGDGLLDVYLCTYRPTAPAGSGAGGSYAQAAREGDFDWPDEFFAPEQAREFRRRVAEHRQRKGGSMLDQLGPPNVLLVNRGGGRFEVAPENGTVGLWRNSLQATWCDYNLDGRPDLYIPNDWGLNVMFRNDGPGGFTDVTQELGLVFYGFSMGATWGDYDNDGREDLYVSNMYSDAGRRMSARLPGLEGMFVESAMGNWLYRQQEDGRFRQVAIPRGPGLAVMNAGWSWGGCFADFDNDAYQDLYVLNGYFSAPPELDSGLDLESNLWRTMVRADANYTRASFRQSPEWRRTPPPDNLGPQIDARLAGVERVGDRVLVHSLHGRERNRYFANRGGRAFVDASGLSGLDNPADSRGFAILDYDRDGWQDIALVNANEPLFNLYRNEMSSAGAKGGVIAIRFRGGNKTAGPSSEYTGRDGFGARVTVEVGGQRLVREHRCGEGWSTQNSATMVIGIGGQAHAASVTVRWPSGRTAKIERVPEGTLLCAYENPADAPNGMSFTTAPYRVDRATMTGVGQGDGRVAGPEFVMRGLDGRARPARLRAYTTFATTREECAAGLPALRRLRELLQAEGVDLALVPVDPADDDERLAAYNRRWRPTSRLVNVPAGRRAEVAAAFDAAVGGGVPSTVVTDGEGRVMGVTRGRPTLSMLRALLMEPGK